VPGIGPVGARSILKERQQGHICNMGDLRRMGINVARAASFILINGLRPPQQLQLFNTPQTSY